jgi:hypothetical protein
VHAMSGRAACCKQVRHICRCRVNVHFFRQFI